MARSTFYPTTLTERVASAPGAKRRSIITVLVTMPHVQKYGKRAKMSLTYACSFDVAVGDHVLCPPTRLNAKWTPGVVTALNSNGYRGPVKYVAAAGAKRKSVAGETS